MSDINVKAVCDYFDHNIKEEKSEFKFKKWNAETAFKRLSISREVSKNLIDGINENADSMPLTTRKLYDEIIQLIKKIEIAEIETIRYGE